MGGEGTQDTNVTERTAVDNFKATAGKSVPSSDLSIGKAKVAEATTTSSTTKPAQGKVILTTTTTGNRPNNADAGIDTENPNSASPLNKRRPSAGVLAGVEPSTVVERDDESTESGSSLHSPAIEGGEGRGGMPMLPLRRSTPRPLRSSFVGAFPAIGSTHAGVAQVRGSLTSHAGGSIASSINDSLAAMASGRSIAGSINDSLAVASEIDDDFCDIEMPTARPHTSPPKEQLKGKQQQDRKLMVGLTLVFLVIATVSISLLALLGANEQEEEKSSAPSAAPTSSTTDSVLSLFSKETANTIVRRPGTPQRKAFDWLLEDQDGLRDLSDERIVQKFALATLFYGLGGESWSDATNWMNHSVHECDWAIKSSFGRTLAVRRFLPTYLDGFLDRSSSSSSQEQQHATVPPAQCNSMGLYQHLWLDDNNLVGSIPTELYMLTTLQTLSMDMNRLQGSLPTYIGQLTAAKGISIKNVGGLTGTIPTQVGSLSDLKVFLVGRSQIRGTIPSELWQRTTLSYLGFGELQVTGTIPTAIGLLTDLKWVTMDECNLSGTIPTEIGQATALEWLIINKQRLSGTIPSEIGNLSKATVVGLSENLLVGTLPSHLGLLTSLTHLSTWNNNISGQIPSEFGRLTNLLVSLNVKDSLHTGSIPTQLGRLTRLRQLEFSNNQLSGSIPSELGETSLGNLDLANNTLSGPIPLELSASLPESLHTMTLDGNPMLVGTIPEAFCSFNATCKKDPLKESACSGRMGLYFDCSDVLCGCSCSCNSSTVDL